MALMTERRLLELCFSRYESAALAVSGGVDSLTIATFAARQLGSRCEIYHAVSSAVPPEATARTVSLANREGWVLHLIDAHEFDDPDYRKNPVNRCYYCKSRLYSTIRNYTSGQIFSGTNTDDLSDYRPGLQAAETHGVCHPYVEAGMNKDAVRRLSRTLGLGAIAELPAAPCLSSRIQTGIAVDPRSLQLIHRAERQVATIICVETVRCRLRHDAIAIEIDEQSRLNLTDLERRQIVHEVMDIFADDYAGRAVNIEAYSRGSAFLQPEVTSRASV